jgi:hypothetical protein
MELEVKGQNGCEGIRYLSKELSNELKMKYNELSRKFQAPNTKTQTNSNDRKPKE